MYLRTTIHTSFLLLFLFAQPVVGVAGVEETLAPPAGLSRDEALRLGEAMYREGRLPSGEPMNALVQRDIVVQGNEVTCFNCHMRSGLGSLEGGVTTLPTNGARLYAPLRSAYELPSTSMGFRPIKAPRPAYTDEALAKALWLGIDPAGRVMSETMPRYSLNAREMEIMIFYLKNLASTYSPGITKDLIRLATVVSEGVRPDDRDSMLVPLTSFVEHFPWKLSLDVWELKGPQQTWKEQLEKYYRQQPVFLLAGGLVTGSWSPVHEFCERNAIPCILPITDLPVISKGDWYTLYFSKGYYQEGDAAAKYLAHGIEIPAERRIVQVSREHDEGKALSEGFAAAWEKLGTSPVINVTVSANDTTDGDFWKRLTALHPEAVLLLWLGPEDLAAIGSLGELPKKPSMVFVSSTLLGDDLSPLPEKVRDFTFITYPYQLPEEREYLLSVVDQIYRPRKINPKNKTIAAKTFTLTRLLSQAFQGMKNDRYRDYLLDQFDMFEDQIGTAVMYPRLSFGPGQRSASKGCYIVTITKDQPPKLLKKSEWVIY